MIPYSSLFFVHMNRMQAQRAAEAAVRRELDAWHKAHPTASAHTADDKAALQVIAIALEYNSTQSAIAVIVDIRL
jgi:hypothetical protein